MIRRALRYLPSVFVAVAMTLAYFTATAFAANAATGEDASVYEIAKAVYEAFSNHQYALFGALIVVLTVAIAKRYLGDKIAWLHTDAGGSTLVLVGTSATAAAAALATPGAHLTFDLFKSALMVGVVAAGGFSMIKNLIVEPFIKPLAARAPAWTQPIFTLIFFIFDHAAVDREVRAEIVEAEKAGEAAVKTNPGMGVSGVIGTPSELP